MSNIIVRSNITGKKSTLTTTNVVYQFKRNTENCETRHYISRTTCFLSRRLKNHMNSRATKEHFRQKHGMPLTRDDLVNNMNILAHSNNTRRLETLGAVYIREKSPTFRNSDESI